MWTSTSRSWIGHSKLDEFSKVLRTEAAKIPDCRRRHDASHRQTRTLYAEIDRERAASLGCQRARNRRYARVAVGGDDRVSRYRDDSVDDSYDVELRLVGIDRQMSKRFRNCIFEPIQTLPPSIL